MKKGLKIGLILGGTALLLGTAIYFVTKKPKEEKADDGSSDKDKNPDKDVDKDSDKKNTDTESNNKQKKDTKPKNTDGNPKASNAPDKKPATNDGKPRQPNFSGLYLDSILKKLENPKALSGKSLITTQDNVILYKKDGNLRVTKGTNVGKYIDSFLTKNGFYNVTVLMNNGKKIQTNAQHFKII